MTNGQPKVTNTKNKSKPKKRIHSDQFEDEKSEVSSLESKTRRLHKKRKQTPVAIKIAQRLWSCRQRAQVWLEKKKEVAQVSSPVEKRHAPTSNERLISKRFRN